MSHPHHPLESTMKQCRFTKSVSFHRGGGGLSVCVSSQVPAGSLYGRRAAQSPVSHRKREWTLGWGCWTTGKLAGHTDQRHSLNLFAQPCPNPTTLPPLPSASPFLIIHCWPANISLPAPPPAEVQSRPGARVTNARPGLAALFCPFSFFHCFTRSPVSSAVHVRFPRAMGPLPGGGGALGKVWEVCGTQGQEAYRGDGD